MPVDAPAQVFLDQLAAVEADAVAPSAPEMRTMYSLFCQSTRVANVSVPTENRTVAGRDGEIPIRIYRPEGSDLPVIAFFHGGGWTLGNLESHDSVCAELAAGVPAVVVSVDYRLAPEHPFPAALHDCLDALAWIGVNGAMLGGDPTRLAVAGDSAGGNLAAVVARHSRDAEIPPVS